jgi:hypothetical protein
MANDRINDSDPRHHTAKVKDMFGGIIDHLRQDVEKISDPKAQALFETSAGVLQGLKKAFEDYEKRNEAAWRKAS